MGTGNKGSWYKLLIDKMDQSINSRHYFEAIFIEYMIIDDRLKTLAKLAGLELVRTDRNPKMMGQLIDELKTEKKKQSIAQWHLLDQGIPLASKDFLETIKKEKYTPELVRQCNLAPRRLVNAYRNPKSGKYLSHYGAANEPLLSQIQKWADKRNHWMHAAGDDALTKEEYEAEITPLAIDGNSLAREMCDITNKIKRGIQKERRLREDT